MGSGHLGSEPAGPGPLGGVRVLELGSFIAGPFAGQLLGDYGAEVIKVEDPEHGDPMRRWGVTRDGESLWWPAIGRNKRSVAIDMRSPQGRALVGDPRPHPRSSSRTSAPAASSNGASGIPRWRPATPRWSSCTSAGSARPARGPGWGELHFLSNPLQRTRRDVNTIACHTVFDLDQRYRSMGRALLGLRTESTWH